jgi:hypothetical protein
MSHFNQLIGTLLIQPTEFQSNNVHPIDNLLNVIWPQFDQKYLNVSIGLKIQKKKNSK